MIWSKAKWAYEKREQSSMDNKFRLGDWGSYLHESKTHVDWLFDQQLWYKVMSHLKTYTLSLLNMNLDHSRETVT